MSFTIQTLQHKPMKSNGVLNGIFLLWFHGRKTKREQIGICVPSLIGESTSGYDGHEMMQQMYPILEVALKKKERE